MGFVMLIEDEAAEAYGILAPHMRLRSTNTDEIGTNISLANQTICVLNEYLQSKD